MADKKQKIKDQMARTRAALAEKIARIGRKVDNGVNTANNAMETVQNVFDLPTQVRRHPWAFVGGSVAVGYLANHLLNQLTDQPPHFPPSMHGAPLTASAAPPPSPPPAPAPGKASANYGWMNQLTSMFADEIAKVKTLAVGTAMGVVRDLAQQFVPDQFKPHVQELVNNLTTQFGGEIVEEPLVADFQKSEHPGRETNGRHGWRVRSA